MAGERIGCLLHRLYIIGQSHPNILWCVSLVNHFYPANEFLRPIRGQVFDCLFCDHDLVYYAFGIAINDQGAQSPVTETAIRHD
jgi:hypothetical protein